MKLKKKIPHITNLSTTTTIITTQEFNKFNKLTSENFTARLKQENLASKNDIANFVENADFDIKPKNGASNKNELNELSKKVKAISTK